MALTQMVAMRRSQKEIAVDNVRSLDANPRNSPTLTHSSSPGLHAAALASSSPGVIRRQATISWDKTQAPPPPSAPISAAGSFQEEQKKGLPVDVNKALPQILPGADELSITPFFFFWYGTGPVRDDISSACTLQVLSWSPILWAKICETSSALNNWMAHWPMPLRTYM